MCLRKSISGRRPRPPLGRLAHGPELQRPWRHRCELDPRPPTPRWPAGQHLNRLGPVGLTRATNPRRSQGLWKPPQGHRQAVSPQEQRLLPLTKSPRGLQPCASEQSYRGGAGPGQGWFVAEKQREQISSSLFPSFFHGEHEQGVINSYCEIWGEPLNLFGRLSPQPLFYGLVCSGQPSWGRKESFWVFFAYLFWLPRGT